MINNDVNTIVTIHNYWYVHTYMYIKSKPKLIVQLLSHMYYYTQRKTPSGRVGWGWGSVCVGGWVANLFKQQNHKIEG